MVCIRFCFLRGGGPFKPGGIPYLEFEKIKPVTTVDSVAYNIVKYDNLSIKNGHYLVYVKYTTTFVYNYFFCSIKIIWLLYVQDYQYPISLKQITT